MAFAMVRNGVVAVEWYCGEGFCVKSVPNVFYRPGAGCGRVHSALAAMNRLCSLALSCRGGCSTSMTEGAGCR
jgi:hypothetical protein